MLGCMTRKCEEAAIAKPPFFLATECFSGLIVLAYTFSGLFQKHAFWIQLKINPRVLHGSTDSHLCNKYSRIEKPLNGCLIAVQESVQRVFNLLLYVRSSEFLDQVCEAVIWWFQYWPKLHLLLIDSSKLCFNICKSMQCFGMALERQLMLLQSFIQLASYFDQVPCVMLISTCVLGHNCETTFLATKAWILLCQLKSWKPGFPRLYQCHLVAFVFAKSSFEFRRQNMRQTCFSVCMSSIFEYATVLVRLEGKIGLPHWPYRMFHRVVFVMYLFAFSLFLSVVTQFM